MFFSFFVFPSKIYFLCPFSLLFKYFIFFCIFSLLQCWDFFLLLAGEGVVEGGGGEGKGRKVDEKKFSFKILYFLSSFSNHSYLF
uniref:Putative secreted protein n=1 Tax=Lutzomyia longipalpis TaxID=7200 RepID=A0A7G3AHF2_LUTLO